MKCKAFAFSVAIWGILAVTGLDQAQAQVASAVISGTLRDETGALLPGVGVEVKNVETGVTRSLVTGEGGTYHAPNLSPGRYQVAASLTGFQTEVRSGIVLSVGRQAVVDFTLKIGEISEQVTVVGEAPLVDTSSAALSELVDDKKIRDLPLNGRDYVQLTTLQPGVAIHAARGQSFGNRVSRGAGVSLTVGGARTGQNNYLLDGVTLNDFTNNTPGSVAGGNLGVDAIREFRVLTNAYSAEFGRAAGAVVTAVTRSGTNEFHGSGFYFHRNDNLDAKNFFSLVKPEFRRHQFGATAGGRILRDKTFYFGSWEGLREALGLTARITTLTQTGRQGILPGGNVTVDPKIRPLVDLYPLPNVSIAGRTEAGLFVTNPQRVTTEDYFTGKLDHHFSDKDTLSGSFVFDNSDFLEPNTFAQILTGGLSNRRYFSLTQTHVFGPSLLNELRFGFARTHLIDGQNVTLDQRLLNPAISMIPGRAAGAIDVGGLTSLQGAAGGQDVDIWSYNSFQVVDNVNVTRARHSVRFGFNVDRMQYNQSSDRQANGAMAFGSIADFLTNRPRDFSGRLPGADLVRGWRQTLAGFYVQDDLTVRRGLTMNLGLRYEFATVIDEVQEKIANLRNPLTDTGTTVGRPFYKNPSLRDFAPRIGLAWDPTGSGKMAIRLGYGIFYDQLLVTNIITAGVRNLPFFAIGNVNLAPGDFPLGGFEKIKNIRLDFSRARTERTEFEPSSSYRQQWNLNIQRELPWNSVATVAYAGSRGTHLSRHASDFNLAIPTTRDGKLFFPPGLPKRNPALGSIQGKIWDGNSFYHSLQMGWNKRWNRGFQAQVAYTISKSVDDFSGVFNTLDSGNTFTTPWPDDHKFIRGLSDFDFRHNATINYTWDIPAPGNLSPALDKLIGGWQLGGIVSFRSGIPITSLVGLDRARTAFTRPFGFFGQTPNLLSGSKNLRTGDINRWFDTSRIGLAEPGFFGNLGRNTTFGPGFANVDFSLFKRIMMPSVREGFEVDLRFEFFNFLNHPNFGLPGLDVFGSQGLLLPNAGLITSTVNKNREIQMGLKILW
ncbi:MAG: TonB-dependent receptor [Acidobacteria bacterium]|nr:TonB-dependent receptor [Acidobacteriota bacterium]